LLEQYIMAGDLKGTVMRYFLLLSLTKAPLSIRVIEAPGTA
jgi:hypothetical protein